MNINPAQLEDNLNKLPAEIRDQEKKVIAADEKLQQAKLELEVATAQAMLTADKPNATEKKAYAIIKTQMEKKALIEAQIDYDKENSGLEYLKNRFTSLRKIASIEIELTKCNLTGN